MTTETILSDQQVKSEIIRIRKLFGLTSKKMCEFMNMNSQTFRNNISKSNMTNNFKHCDFFRLKNELSKTINSYKYDTHTH